MKPQKLFRKFFVLFILSLSQGYSQPLFFTDVGNNILTKPNLGFEYRKGKNGYYAAGQWHRIYFGGGCEAPSI